MIRQFILSLLLFLVGLLLSILTFRIFVGEAQPTFVAIVINSKGDSILAGVIWEELLSRLIIIRFFLKKGLYFSIIFSALLFSLAHIFNDTNGIAHIGYFIGGIYYGAYWLFFDILKSKQYYFLAYGMGIHYGWNSWQFVVFKDFQYENSITNIYQRLVILFISLLLFWAMKKYIKHRNFSRTF